MAPASADPCSRSHQAAPAGAASTRSTRSPTAGAPNQHPSTTGGSSGSNSTSNSRGAGRTEHLVAWHASLPSAVAGTVTARATEIRTEQVAEHALVLAPSGEVDLASVPALREAIDTALASVASVVLDLADVSFIDSSIIGVITTASRDVARREAGTQLVVAAPPGSHPRRVLDMVNAETFLRIYGDRTAALASIGW